MPNTICFPLQLQEGLPGTLEARGRGGEVRADPGRRGSRPRGPRRRSLLPWPGAPLPALPRTRAETEGRPAGCAAAEPERRPDGAQTSCQHHPLAARAGAALRLSPALSWALPTRGALAYRNVCCDSRQGWDTFLLESFPHFCFSFPSDFPFLGT